MNATNEDGALQADRHDNDRSWLNDFLFLFLALGFIELCKRMKCAEYWHGRLDWVYTFQFGLGVFGTSTILNFVGFRYDYHFLFSIGVFMFILSTPFLVYLMFIQKYPTDDERKERFFKPIGEALINNVKTFAILVVCGMLPFLELLFTKVYNVFDGDKNEFKEGNVFVQSLKCVGMQLLFAVSFVLIMSYYFLLMGMFFASLLIAIVGLLPPDPQSRSWKWVAWMFCRFTMILLFYKWMELIDGASDSESFLASLVVKFSQHMVMNGPSSFARGMSIWMAALFGWVAVILAVPWLVPRIQLWRQHEYAYLPNVVELPLRVI